MNKQSMKPPRKAVGASSAPDGKASKGKRKAEHPLAALSGIFKDDPLWPEFVEAMHRARIEEDEATHAIFVSLPAR